MIIQTNIKLNIFFMFHSIELNMNMPGMASTSLGQSTVTTEQDELSQRLAKLRDT